MTNILVPLGWEGFVDEIHQALLLVEQQGFAVNELQVTTATEEAVVIQDGDSRCYLSADCFRSGSTVNENVRTLRYQSRDLRTFLLESKTEETVYLNVMDGETTLDVWRAGSEFKALQCSRPIEDFATQRRHFAWTVTLTALDFPIEDTLTLARAMTEVSRETWPTDFSQFPIPILEHSGLEIRVGWSVDSDRVESPTLTKQSLGLYPVVDSVEWIERLLKLGITTVQLRIKDAHRTDLEAQVKRAIELGQQYQAQVFINDYWQLAIKHGAYGVHLGQEDIEESNLTQLSNAGIRLGLSTHGYYELLRIIQIQPSYIALGHIFPTTTKVMPSKPQGLVRLALYQKLIDTIPYGEGIGYPTVAIGGIDQSNAPLVWDCGVSSLAVVRAITLSQSPKTVIDEFARIMSSDSQVKETVHAE